MKKLTMIGMMTLLVLAASCKKDKKDGIENAGSGFSATVESQEGTSRTHLDGNAVKWNSGDAILVKSSTCTTPKKFKTTGSGASAIFDAQESLPADFYAPDYTAYYPAGDESSGFLADQLTLPATQTYEAGTFASGANPMAARSSTTTLPFKNVCGVLKLELYNNSGSPCNVANITIKSNKEGEKLWGTGTVSIDGSGLPSLGTLSGGGSTLTLNCNGETMSTDEAQPSAYFFVVPANTLGTSFTVRVTDSNGEVWTKTASSSQNLIGRSKITVMPKCLVATHVPVTPREVTLTAGCSSSNVYNFSGTITVPCATTCEYGLVYSTTDPTPTIEAGATKYIAESAASVTSSKDFSVDLTSIDGITGTTTYYVRSYAKCDGVCYSKNAQEVSAEPKSTTWTGGKLPGLFSVGSTKQVHFSQGNLQYNASGSSATVEPGQNVGGTWRFAEHQFDFIGDANSNIAQTYDGWIDLFGWGTSGNAPTDDSYYVYYQPWATPLSAYDYYGPSMNSTYPNLTVSNGSDWGANSIYAGKDLTTGWYTLTNGEWEYLLRTRPNATNLYGEGKVGNCTCGLIILPDDWTVCPSDLTFTSGNSEWSNVYSYSDWALMEAAGAVFIPAAGSRIGTGVYAVGVGGCFWSSSCHVDAGKACIYAFNGLDGGAVYSGPGGRSTGASVRLVSED